MMGTTRGRIIECAWLLCGSFLGSARPTFWMDAINMGVLTPSILLSSPPFLPLSGGIHAWPPCATALVSVSSPLRSPFPSHPRVVTSTKFTTVKLRTKGSMARSFSISIGANARHARWADSFRAFEGYRGLPIPTTRATNVPWNGSMENRVPWRCAR